MKQEQKARKDNLIRFAMNCSDYVTMSEAFSLPFQYREMIYKFAEERSKAMSKST